MARLTVPPIVLVNPRYVEQVWKRLVLAGAVVELEVVRETLLAAGVSETPPPLPRAEDTPLPLPAGKPPRHPIRARPRPADV